MVAVGGVQAVAVQDVVAALKQVPALPVGVTVIVTLSPLAKPDTGYDNTLPIGPTLFTAPPFTW